DRGIARQLLALEQLEARAAARRDPRDLLGQTELVQRAHRVRSADDRERPLVRGDSLCDRLCPAGEPWPFEDTHRAVPEDRARSGDRVREPLARLGPDVEAEPVLR